MTDKIGIELDKRLFEEALGCILLAVLYHIVQMHVLMICPQDIFNCRAYLSLQRAPSHAIS